MVFLREDVQTSHQNTQTSIHTAQIEANSCNPKNDPARNYLQIRLKRFPNYAVVESLAERSLEATLSFVLFIFKKN